MALRIGFDGAMLSAPHTGSGQYSAALLAALRGMPETAIVVLAPEPLAAEPEASVVPPPRRLPGARVRKVWWEQVGIGRAAARAGTDVVHIPYFAAPLRPSLPCVVTVHDVIPLLLPAYAGGRAMHAYLRLVSAGTRRATQIIADSECSRRDIIRVLGIEPSRVTSVPLAVSAEYRPERDDAAIDLLRDRFDLAGKQVIFNQAGLDVRKNVATLLRAFARVRAALGDSVRLVVAGKAHGNPTLYPDPVPLARELGIAESVIFPGPFSTAEKIAFYHLADCYAAPSVYEGFGLTPLEAMACGTPVVAADASCTPEVVGDAALLVPPYDVQGFSAALIRVLTDETLAREMRDNGLAQAARFSWERTASATRAIYEAACGATSPVALHVSRERSAEVVR